MVFEVFEGVYAKNIIYFFFFRGGGVYDVNFVKLEVNLYCILLVYKFFVI